MKGKLYGAIEFDTNVINNSMENRNNFMNKYYLNESKVEDGMKVVWMPKDMNDLCMYNDTIIGGHNI